MTPFRYLFMAMPSQAVRDAMQVLIQRYGVDKQLGRALFAPTNWHQSLSDRHWEGGAPDLLARLMRAGDRVSAQAVPMTLNRIIAHGEHWSFKARGSPEGFARLLGALHAAMAAEGIDDRVGHTPHVTISYTAPPEPRPPRIKESIEWILDELLLVAGGGSPYCYRVLGRWPLGAIPASRQQSLF